MTNFTVLTDEQAAHDAATSKRLLEDLRELQAENARLRAQVETCKEQFQFFVDSDPRTTPEGFALVPVPEWMPFDDLVSYPAPESSGWFWYIKDDEIFRGTAMHVCLARGVTYWCPADNPPAPPKSEPL